MPPSPQNAEVTETGLKEMKFGKEELNSANKETYFFMKSKFKTSKLKKGNPNFLSYLLS